MFTAALLKVWASLCSQFCLEGDTSRESPALRNSFLKTLLGPRPRPRIWLQPATLNPKSEQFLRDRTTIFNFILMTTPDAVNGLDPNTP